MPIVLRSPMILSGEQIASNVIQNKHIVDNAIAFEKLNDVVKIFILMGI